MILVFSTRNTEYHLDHQRCVAVRDRVSGAFIASHPALQEEVPYMVTRVRGALRKHVFSPRVGSALCFPRLPLTTGSIRLIREARPEEIQRYPSMIPATAPGVRVSQLPLRRGRVGVDETGEQPIEAHREEELIELDSDWLEDAI